MLQASRLRIRLPRPSSRGAGQRKKWHTYLDRPYVRPLPAPGELPGGQEVELPNPHVLARRSLGRNTGYFSISWLLLF